MLCLLFCLLSFASAANILVFNPTFGHSHVRFLGNIADLLAADGHNVTVLTSVQDESIPPFGCKHPSIHKILFKSPYLEQTEISGVSVKSSDFWNQPPPQGRAMSMEDVERFRISGTAGFKGLIEAKSLLESLKSSKFDLGVAEFYSLNAVGIFELIGIKTSIAGAALGATIFPQELLGLPSFPSFVPSWISTFSEKMTFWERLDNWKSVLEARLGSYLDWRTMNEMFQERYPGFPDLFDVMRRQIGVVLSNTNEFTESPRLRTNMVQYIGGANVHPSKPLNKELDELLSQRSANVLFSLGTFVKSCKIPTNLKNEILETFDSFPDVTFIWKYEKCENDTTDFSRHPNVFPMEWVPQTDLLGDPRLNVFITHAGMNSMIEVAFRGKPTITIPLFADQYINAKNAVNRGLTVMIARNELSKETLSAALKKTLAPNNEIAYKASIAAAVLKGKDEEYRQSITRWANLLIEYGRMEHLRLPSADLSLMELYSIDCILFVVALLFSIVLATAILVKIVISVLRRLFTSKKEKKL